LSRKLGNVKFREWYLDLGGFYIVNRKISIFLRVLVLLVILCSVMVGLFYKLTYEPKAKDAYRFAVKYATEKFCKRSSEADTFGESKITKINSNEYQVESTVHDIKSESSFGSISASVGKMTRFSAIMRYEGGLFGKWKVMEITDLSGKDPEILESIHQGDKERVIELLNSGVDVDQVYQRLTALMMAVREENIELVRLLVEDYGADVNIQSPPGDLETALHFAVGTGNREIVEILLENGADLKIRDSWYRTPIFYADSRLKTVSQLISAGADLNTVNRNGYTPLALFILNDYVYFSNLETLRALAKKTADLETPLLYAVEDNHKAVIKMLLEEGANRNIRDPKGNRITIN